MSELLRRRSHISSCLYWQVLGAACSIEVSSRSTTTSNASARETPPSLRFLGRRVYVAAIVVLISI
jgi:hypothetical protein